MMLVQLPFDDRLHAAGLLAQALAHLRGRRPLVLAVPRGAVPMARVIADALGGELDIVQVRKIGSPFNPEYALGAVDESGWRYLATAAQSVDPATIDAIAEREIRRMRERRASWSAARAPTDPAGRVVIVVDDGSTDATRSIVTRLAQSDARIRLLDGPGRGPAAAPYGDCGDLGGLGCPGTGSADGSRRRQRAL